MQITVSRSKNGLVGSNNKKVLGVVFGCLLVGFTFKIPPQILPKYTRSTSQILYPPQVSRHRPKHCFFVFWGGGLVVLVVVLVLLGMVFWSQTTLRSTRTTTRTAKIGQITL